MSKSAHQALTEARALIASKETWTQHAFARNETGLAVYSKSPEAVCFCALGALNHVVDTNSGVHLAYRLLSLAASALFGDGAPAQVNDQLGHEAVLKMYDHALEAAQS